MSRRTKHELNFSDGSIVIETDNATGYYETPHAILTFDTDSGLELEGRGFGTIKFEDAESIQELIDSLELAKKELM